HRVIAVECWGRAIYDPNNHFQGWLITMINIEQRVASERKNRDLLQKLQSEQQQLRESNRELESFAYIASHDLQEPLRMISSFIQLLDRRYSDQLDDSAREFIKFAVDGSTRMQQMINDLLSYSRVGSSANPLQPVELQPLIDAAIANLQHAIDHRGATITMTPTNAIIMGDSSQIIRLLQNLLSNAIKFQPDNQTAEITITIEERPLRIKVADNGIGIPPAYRAKVFDIFKRLHNRERYSGSGIGLAVCHRIVSRHGGSLTIANQPEGQPGTTFIVTLPQPEEE
ncbi:MAG: ATP-binding protein, partial [Mariprofundales bacterium]|nr:ATP-binding protein [Mariprofundales bacterium]